MLLKSCFTSLAPSRRTIHVDVNDLSLPLRGGGRAADFVIDFRIVDHASDPILYRRIGRSGGGRVGVCLPKLSGGAQRPDPRKAGECLFRPRSSPRRVQAPLASFRMRFARQTGSRLTGPHANPPSSHGARSQTSCSSAVVRIMPYHSGYIFVPATWFENMVSFEIGKFEDWCAPGFSDHAPLTAEFG